VDDLEGSHYENLEGEEDQRSVAIWRKVKSQMGQERL